MARTSQEKPSRVRAWLGSLLDAGALGAAYLATFLPQRMDRRLVAAWVRFNRLRRTRLTSVASRIERALGPAGSGGGRGGTAAEYLAMRAETHLQRARALHRPRPSISLTVDGIEHLEAALADGHGALLWRMYFCSSHVTKQALADAGHPLVHLSTWSHGSRFDTALGLKVFAPAYIEAEVRHLKRRIVIPRDGSLGYLRKLLAHLNANDIVSIFGELEGRAATSVTVFGRELQIASGTPSLARRSGAAMLPTYTERIGPDVYRVVVEEPIVVDPGLARREFVTAASREFASRLEEAVRRHPASWNRWEAD